MVLGAFQSVAKPADDVEQRPSGDEQAGDVVLAAQALGREIRLVDRIDVEAGGVDHVVIAVGDVHALGHRRRHLRQCVGLQPVGVIDEGDELARRRGEASAARCRDAAVERPHDADPPIVGRSLVQRAHDRRRRRGVDDEHVLPVGDRLGAHRLEAGAQVPRLGSANEGEHREPGFHRPRPSPTRRRWPMRPARRAVRSSGPADIRRTATSISRAPARASSSSASCPRSRSASASAPPTAALASATSRRRSSWDRSSGPTRLRRRATSARSDCQLGVSVGRHRR